MSAVCSDLGGGGNSGSGIGASGGGSIGGYASAAGQVASSVGEFQAAKASAQADRDAAKRSVVMTQLKLRQQEQGGFRMQGSAEAAIGQQGWAVGGSVAEILRMNAKSLAMDHGIIQEKGSEVESSYLAAAKAADASGTQAIIKGVIAAVAIVAAPFTGGASLLALGAVGAM